MRNVRLWLPGAAVRAFLTEKGLPDRAMFVHAFGESRPLVETPDEVDEAQNRRVEISFGPAEGW